MGLVNDSATSGITNIANKIKNPFDRYFTPELNMKGALERNDFSSGLIISEFEEGQEKKAEEVVLKGNFMPHVPFTFGGEQRLVKDYYPGNSEPTVHVLGSKESNITVRGRFYSKRFEGAVSRSGKIGPNPDFRPVAQEIQELLDAMRIRGNLVRLSMGGFERYGFIESTKFDLATVADIKYEINFFIVGFNKPSDCKVLNTSKKIPFEINKYLISKALEAQDSIGKVPKAMPKSFEDQLNDGISKVAGAINLVTNFVDVVLNEVDSIKSSIARAQGLISYARNQITSFQRRAGVLDPYGGKGTSAGTGVSGQYAIANHLKQASSSVFSLTALLASMSKQLKEIAATEPLSRHRVKSGDTLQKIAITNYHDASQWKEIYDHNKLASTELEIGAILEIPRI